MQNFLIKIFWIKLKERRKTNFKQKIKSISSKRLNQFFKYLYIERLTNSFLSEAKLIAMKKVYSKFI